MAACQCAAPKGLSLVPISQRELSLHVERYILERARGGAMARLSVFILALSISAAGGWAQTSNSEPGPWQVKVEPEPMPEFDLSTGLGEQPSSHRPGSRIVAGTELMPNLTMGVGAFGERGVQSPHTRSTAKNWSSPRQPKAAVGFSLKF